MNELGFFPAQIGPELSPEHLVLQRAWRPSAARALRPPTPVVGATLGGHQLRSELEGPEKTRISINNSLLHW